MRSGDGWLVRIRPPVARLNAAQALGLAAAAERFGAGLIDLTNRANLQIRGVPDTALPALQDALDGLGLLDPDPEHEARRNILVAPDWVEGDDSARIAAALGRRIAELPDLPAKTGVAIDAGPAPVLGKVPADFRIERAAEGTLLLRADGHDLGVALAPGTEAEAVLRLAHWFVDSGGGAAGRMARHTARLPEWASGTLPPAPSRPTPLPGCHRAGLVVGAAFGQITAQALGALIRMTGTSGLRITPWRCVIAEGVNTVPEGLPAALLTTADAALLRVDACAGAPLCPQAQAETRQLAGQLAGRVQGRVHVSGCAKGCARSRPADITLVGRAGRFDLVRAGSTGDLPEHRALSRHEVLALLCPST